MNRTHSGIATWMAQGRKWLPVLLCSVGLLLFSTTALYAQEPDAQPDATTADDGGSWEVGIHGSAGNLTTATAAERQGMWHWLNGWYVLRYSYNETWAWEEDFKRGALGGTENSYIDTVDLQFYVGHGAPGLFTFDNATHDDGTLQSPGDCNTAWGDGDNEWLALTSCQVLADAALGNLAQCMNRQHLILGFVTNASAHNTASSTQAYHFGRYLRSGYNMTQAWFSACDVAQRGRITRVIAEETACFNDNPYASSVCADVLDSDYYWYTHNCGTESASYVPVSQLASMPVFVFKPYSLAEAERDFDNLGGVFGVPITPTLQSAAPSEGPGTPPVPGDSDFLVSGDGSLEVDTNSGIYRYSDLDTLWTGQAAEQAMAARAASVNYLTADDAEQIATAFLTNNGLMPGDAVFYEVAQDTTGALGRDTVASAAAVSAAETPALQQVIYTRKITGTVLTAAGVAEDIPFTVVGPGAKQKVYLPTVLPPTMSAADMAAEPPLGVQGGWRELEPLVNAATGQQVMATILDEPTAQSLYLALDDEVSMNSLPLDILGREILSSTLAYWEEAAGASQGHLIPVFEFTVRFTEATTSQVSEDLVYVPASTEYLRPLARILDAPSGVTAGIAVTLTAADAAQTLKALGIGDQFDFVMGYNGANGTYTYDWYLDSVDAANKITDLNTTDGARQITFVPQVAADDRDRSLTVLLVVTDTDSPNASTSTAEATMQAELLFMPTVQQ